MWPTNSLTCCPTTAFALRVARLIRSCCFDVEILHLYPLARAACEIGVRRIVNGVRLVVGSGRSAGRKLALGMATYCLVAAILPDGCRAGHHGGEVALRVAQLHGRHFDRQILQPRLPSETDRGEKASQT